MEIIKYTEQYKDAWDDFVLGSNNGTMFHLQKFFDYHEEGKFDFYHLIFFEKGKIVGVLPGAIMDGIYESPIGASYGSIVTKDLKFDMALHMVDALVDYSKKNRFKGIMLTSAPMIYESKPNQNLDFALLWRGFSYDLHYISSAVKLDSDLDILSRFQSTVRRNIRKTYQFRDLRIEVNERYDQFYPILLKNKSKHNVKPTHSLEDLLKLKTLLPDNLRLYMIYLKDKPIGGSLMFYPNRTVALCFYNMLLYEYAHYKPIHRVMYEVVKDATELDFKYVDIGVSQDTSAENPMTPSLNLINFKEKFDARTIMRNTLYLKL
jgi:hypothetical protein